MKDTSVWKIVVKVLAVLAVVAGVIFAIYHWELDKKFLAWVKNLRSKCCCCCSGEEVEEITDEPAEEEAVEPMAEEPVGIVPECTMEDVAVEEEVTAE